MNRTRQLSGLLLALVLPIAPYCMAQSLVVGEVLQSPAAMVPNPQRAVYTAIARAGERLVAVGERGLILLSDDNGQQWRQAEVPVSVGLTAVQFANAECGWAVGHAGVVLATRDGGQHWTLQLDGRRAAQLELDAAQQDLADNPDSDAGQARVETAERVLAEPADKPFLALLVSDARQVLVVGAYGLAMRTDDAGVSWRSTMGQIDNPMGLHLYAAARQGTAWLLAGEQGYLARAAEGGRFEQLPSPYAGTFFTLTRRADDAVVLGGLNGNAFVLAADAQTPEALPLLAPVSFTDATALSDGRVLMVNQGGGLFASSGKGFSAVLEPLRKPVSAVVQAVDGSLVFAGYTGLTRLSQPAVSASE
ncbi:hypothetical protein CCOS865_04087 [Pseudomonas reidholzensis]|uniref:Photosynthesis system II assembly factor Ycf48/Hcf136-like domain-containing protein n=1 Tax=Pseudomonas reidholzensis TaxID=1785162 RepID=A0A383RXJ3_9PSED|nr:YCF48-related protein [Pseudomonas reidholzensis]SYX91807.1 hypothetical protein CCOS865_04087 [Pseudomonas reidholzensis]